MFERAKVCSTRSPLIGRRQAGRGIERAGSSCGGQLSGLRRTSGGRDSLVEEQKVGKQCETIVLSRFGHTENLQSGAMEATLRFAPRALLVLGAALLAVCAGAAAGPQPQPQQQQQQQQQQQLQPQLQQQQQQIQTQAQTGANSLQAQLSAMHLQAQRHMGQLNSLVLGAAANLTGAGQPQSQSPVLEALSSVGKAIQQQIGAASSVQIVTGPGAEQQLANSKKNEYQAVDASGAAVSPQAPNYREQSELLRQEIVKRAGQLQQVVASSMELMKNSGDIIVRRLLDQMNVRLDQAKAKADRILSEPATNEVALKALSTVNSGLNNLNGVISNIVARLDAAAKDQQRQQQQQRAGSGPAPSEQQPLLASRLRANLHQLGQQFQSALNASSGQLAPIVRQRHQQLQQALAALGQSPLPLPLPQPQQQQQPQAGSTSQQNAAKATK